MNSRRQTGALYLLFFGSGACALVYETVWVRQLILSFGITTYAISAVLAAYMFGLSLGATWIGRRVGRLTDPLAWYAAFEGGIAVYSMGLYAMLAHVLPSLTHAVATTFPSATTMHVVRFAFAFVLLAPPTLLMGGTLPLLGQLVERGAKRPGAHLGKLYGLNTLGAVVGTGLAGFWMLKNLGIFSTTLTAAVANVLIAGLALRLRVRAAVAAAAATVPKPEMPGCETVVLPFPPRRLIGTVAVLTGFAALSYEILWNRTLLLYVHNSTYAFSTILMCFLLGVGAGSMAYARYARRWTSLRALGIIQLLLAVSVSASIFITGLLPSLLSRVTRVIGAGSWFAALANMSIAVSLVVLIPTFLMGVGFPMTAALYAADADVGASVGDLYALNTIGNILGSVVTGFVFLGLIGVRNSFAVSVGFNLTAAFACLLWQRRAPRRLLWAAGLAAAGVALFVSVVSAGVFRHAYEKIAKVIFYKEEVTDTVIVIETPAGARMIRYSDGRGTAGTNTDFANRLYGHIPMLLHPRPDSVLSITFGVGNTLSALAQWEPRRLLCVELSPAVLETAKYFWTNRDVLHTPGLDVRIDDGRNFLLTSDEHFDVVQLEPPEIHTAGVVNLYTREFYELARRDMNPGGILEQWMNVVLMPEPEMKMLIRTMQEVFPYTSLWTSDAWWDVVLVGSMTPIHVRPGDMTARLARPQVRADLDQLGIAGSDQLLAHHVLGPDALRAYVDGVPIVTDDRTYVDFSVPQSAEAGFGLFLYQTNQAGPKAKSAERIRQRLTMLANRESPLYLVDLSGLPAAEQDRLRTALAAEVELQRAKSRAELERTPH